MFKEVLDKYKTAGFHLFEEEAFVIKLDIYYDDNLSIKGWMYSIGYFKYLYVKDLNESYYNKDLVNTPDAAYEFIEDGLIDFINEYKRQRITTIHRREILNQFIKEIIELSKS